MRRKVKALVLAGVLGASAFVLAPAGAGGVEATVTRAMTSEPSMKPVAVALLPGPEQNENSATRLSATEALDILRVAFPHLPDGEPRIHLDEDRHLGRTVWQIEAFRPHVSYRPGPSSGYYATVDADTGEILNFSLQPYSLMDPGEAKGVISHEEARRTAEKLARQLQPERFGQMKLSDDTRYRYYSPDFLDISYHFAWKRVHNGVDVDHDGLGITVDALTGRVLQYHYNWQPDIGFPRPGPVVDAATLPEKIAAEVGMVPVYTVPGDGRPFAVPQLRLVYRLNSQYAHTVDARTGGLLDYLGRPLPPDRWKMYPDTSHIRGVANPPAPSGQPVSSATALEAAQRFLDVIGVSGKMERSGSGSSGGPLGRQEYWYYGVVSETGASLGSVGIDMYTGKVVSFDRGGRFEHQPAPVAEAVNREQALRQAWDLVRKVNPEYAGNVVATADGRYWTPDEDGHSVRFTRVVNGIVFPTDGIDVILSAAGDLLEYRCEWHRLDFPAAGKIITPEEAVRKWMENAVYEPVYSLIRGADGRPTTGEAQLIYRLNLIADSVDAVTGAPVSFGGIDRRTGNGYDFSGSWAAQPLQLLADSGLLPAPDQFAPAAPVTRRDAIRVLVAAAGPYYGGQDGPIQPSFPDVPAGDPHFGVIETAVTLNIVSKGAAFHPDRPVTRKELAAWLVNAVGYGEVTRISNQISTPFNDVSALLLRDRNYIGLANGLGFMHGDGAGTFRPADEVTWEELAAAVVKALPRIRAANTRW
ncbi:MAG: YcdB/YcdC domain-containing protein [Bacillota bacterium]